MAEEIDPCLVLSDFIAQCDSVPATEPIIVGIDPGANGAIAFLCGRLCTVVDIPVIKTKIERVRKLSDAQQAATGKKTRKLEGVRTLPNYAGISDLFRVLRTAKARVHVALEEAPLTIGPGRHNADVMLNRAYAMWPLFLHYNGYPLEEIRPRVWKQAMGLGGDNKGKAKSRIKAMKMYPKADIKLVKHEGRAEALLLATYWQRILRGKGE